MWKAFSALKVKGEFKPRVDNVVFRLHYRYTFILFMMGATLSTLYDVVGDQIMCMIDTTDDALKKVVASYCYITGVYTVDKLHYGEVGVDMPHQGVGPHTEDDDTTTHAYYQWVPFVLVAQGALFYLPHLIWKKWEGGLFKNIIQNLSVKDYLSDGKDGKPIGNYFTRKDQFEALSVYIKEFSHQHTRWAVKFLSCEAANVLITIFTIFFTNFFLGGEFLTYGIEVFAISDMNPENRTDPMAQVFPRMGKCTFKMFGPSGTIEERDVMCLLPTNIANEKIYMVMWFWLIILSCIGGLWLLARIVTLVKIIRDQMFMIRVYSIPRYYSNGYKELEERLATKEQVRTVLKDTDVGDYILLTQMGDNMDSALFSEFVAYLASSYDPRDRGSLDDSGMDEEEPLDERHAKKQKEMFELDHPYLKT